MKPRRGTRGRYAPDRGRARAGQSPLPVFFPLVLAFHLQTACADGDELARARIAFDMVKRVPAVEINRLDGQRRRAVWSAYYGALEQLTRMDVHQRMMMQHGQERAAQFAAALAEFDLAMTDLERLLEGLDSE